MTKTPSTRSSFFDEIKTIANQKKISGSAADTSFHNQSFQFSVNQANTKSKFPHPGDPALDDNARETGEVMGPHGQVPP
jgi:hypothetical protein